MASPQSLEPLMMDNYNSDPIGAAWIVRDASIDLVSPLYVSSSIGGRRQTYKDGNVIHNAYQETARPLDDPRQYCGQSIPLNS